jgi:anhydro-N-acetylmuramic acid kinase
MSKKMNAVGIMSGTSLDGVDFVLTRLGSKVRPKFLDIGSVTFPVKLKKKISDLAEGRLSFRESQRLHFELGAFYEKSLKRIQTKNKWKIDLIGLHGQTVFHEAPFATSQIGEPSFLKSFKVPVVSDFRSKILSNGGDGAPLAPLFHAEIMKGEKSWGFLNIGGMSNITIFKDSKISATDLGPGNIFLDKAAENFLKKSFDKGGRFALKGLPDMEIMSSYIKSNSFFKKKAPKSCGREDFSDENFKKIISKMKKLSKEDIMATLAEITLYPILAHLQKNKVDKLIVSGGGVHNLYLMSSLNKSLKSTSVLTSDEIKWPSQAVEGGAFASLAFRKINNISSDLSYMGLKKKLSPLGRVD